MNLDRDRSGLLIGRSFFTFLHFYDFSCNVTVFANRNNLEIPMSIMLSLGGGGGG